MGVQDFLAYQCISLRVLFLFPISFNSLVLGSNVSEQLVMAA